MSVKPMTYARAMKLLGMPTPWNDTILKLKYREKSKASHPDRGGAHNRMVAINAAFNCLKNMPEDARQVMFKQHKADTGRGAEDKRSGKKRVSKEVHDLIRDLWGDKSEGFGGDDYERPSGGERDASPPWNSRWRFRDFGGFGADPDYSAGYEPPPPPKEEPKRYFQVGDQRYRSGVYGGIWTWLGPQHGEPLSEFEGIKGVVIPEYIDEGTRVMATTSDDDQSSTLEVVIVWNKKRDPYSADAPTDVSVGIPIRIIAVLRIHLRDAFDYGDNAAVVSIINQMCLLGADFDYELARLRGIQLI